MTRIVSFDMDGTLIEPGYTDWVWHEGIPELLSKKKRISFEKAKAFVLEEYNKVGEGAIEWYDIKYWFRLFELEMDWKALMKRYLDKINVYPDVDPLLNRLKDRYPLILISNAGREFIDVEMEATGLGRFFETIFSATSDFKEVKKTLRFYERVCERLKVRPEEITHIGDHYEFDFLVPRALGICAYYLDRSAQKEGEFILWNLKNLETRLLPNGTLLQT